MIRERNIRAAERRREENEVRGIKNVDKLREMQRKADELDRLEREVAMKGGPAMKVRKLSYQIDVAIIFMVDKINNV